MTGFTLYETLRIYLPGALAIFLANLVARVALGPDPLIADGGAEGFVEVVQSPMVFLVLSLLAGLVLYLLDFPARLRLNRSGDPEHGAPLPSDVLRDMLEGSELQKKSRSLYFLLTDRYLSLEMHKRVYLFGSLFRVYVDLRMLLAIASVSGVALSISSARDIDGFDPFPGWPLSYYYVITLMWLGLVAIGTIGVLEHRFRFKRARERERRAAAKSGVPEHEVKSRSFGKEIAEEVGEIAWTAIAVAVAIATGMLLSAWAPGVWRGVAALPLMAGLALWMAVEVGPPAARDQEVLVRGKILRSLGVKKDSAQFRITQRLLVDLALLAPTLGFAATAAINLDWVATDLVAWIVFVYPCVAIVAWRKHEVRLLNIFGDQVTWLELHSSDVDRIASEGRLPSDWD